MAQFLKVMDAQMGEVECRRLKTRAGYLAAFSGL